MEWIVATVILVQAVQVYAIWRVMKDIAWVDEKVNACMNEITKHYKYINEAYDLMEKSTKNVVELHDNLIALASYMKDKANAH